MSGSKVRANLRRGATLGLVALAAILAPAALAAWVVGDSPDTQGQEGGPAPIEMVGVAPPPPSVWERIQHSPRGAAIAAARFFEAVLTTGNLRLPGRAVTTLRALGTDSLLADWGTRYAEGLRNLASHLRAETGDTLVRTAALGYRVEAYSPRLASVAVWKVSLIGTTTSGITAAFDTSRITLVWTPRGWRASGLVADVPGPTPQFSQAGNTTTNDETLGPVIAGFRPYLR